MIFINYRRIDSAAEARSLKIIFDGMFVPEETFLDNYSIESGEEWPKRLEFELEKSKILIVIIGPNWLRASDSFGRRLLDNQNDWVRKEIEKAFTNDITIIPVLVSGATQPPSEALPPSIREICNLQFYELRDAHWKTDITPLINRIEKIFSSEISLLNIKWPDDCPDVARRLTPDELSKTLSELTNWKVQTTKVPNKKDERGKELVRKYEFATFLQAIQFMSDASVYIQKINHHPKWENVWKTLIVRLTTFNVGHHISPLDVDLAFYMDNLYNVSYKLDDK